MESKMHDKNGVSKTNGQGNDLPFNQNYLTHSLTKTGLGQPAAPAALGELNKLEEKEQRESRAFILGTGQVPSNQLVSNHRLLPPLSTAMEAC